jgi:hypothetical protein
MTDQASTKDDLTMTSKATSGGAAGRSRRQLLGRGTGVLAAVLTAEALARPAPAAAADGDPVLLGQDNKATTVTQITNTTDSANTLSCAASGSAIAVLGESDSSDGTGVAGISQSGGTGVLGSVNGGTAVLGLSTSGIAVVGKSQGFGDGVHGEAPAGTGVKATGKVALQVQGPAVFDRSGIVTVAAGKSSVKKSGIALTAASLVLATIQGNVAGVHVQGVTLVTGLAGSFTIHLNKAVAAKTKVAWFALN